MGRVDDAHPAAAKLRDDLIRAKGRAGLKQGHSRERLYLRARTHNPEIESIGVQRDDTSGQADEIDRPCRRTASICRANGCCGDFALC